MERERSAREESEDYWRGYAAGNTDAKESQVLQAVLDAIKGTLDPSTEIADHPNVKFAQMRRLDWVLAAADLWVVVAHVNGGDWSQQSLDWQAAAASARDKYANFLAARP